MIKTPKCTKKIVKALRGKCQVTYKHRSIRITHDFSAATKTDRRAWADDRQTQREHKCQHRMQYPANLSITIDREHKVFHDKN